MKGYLFEVDGMKYFTGAETQMDAEEKYFQEYGDYYENHIIVIEDIDDFIKTSTNIIYF